MLARKQNNPLTDQMLLNYLRTEGPMYVTVPVSGREFSTYEWLQIGIGRAGGGFSIFALKEIEGVNPTNPLNSSVATSLRCSLSTLCK